MGMGKHKRIFHFPEQCTPHIHLRSISLKIEGCNSIPEELVEASHLINKRKFKKAFLLVESCFNRNQYNLTVRIRYADLLLLAGKKEKALSLFNMHRDLAKAFPEERSFFLEDYVGFLSFLGHLTLQENTWEAAEEYHYLLYRLAPEDRRTKLLGRKLRKQYSIFARIKKYFSVAVK